MISCGGEKVKVIPSFKLDLKKFKELDKWMLFSIICIVSFGILNIYLATKGNYGIAYLKKQSIFFLVSLVALYFVLATDYNTIKAKAQFIGFYHFSSSQ